MADIASRVKRLIEAEPRSVQVKVRPEMRQVNAFRSSLDRQILCTSFVNGAQSVNIYNVSCRERICSMVQESGTRQMGQRSGELSMRKQGHLSETTLLA